jgi:hypothetical protein
MQVESLEDRRLLAITVNSLIDELDGSVVDGDVSLRDAIAAAPAGETINFSVTGTINLTLGELVIDKDLTISGPGANLLTIDASGNDPTPTMNNLDGSRVFNIDDGSFTTYLPVRISGITITGADNNGGALYSAETLTLASAHVTGNHGGNIVFSQGDLVVENSELTGNSGFSVLAVPYNVQVTNTTISNNMARGITADTFFGGEVVVTDSMISGNTATRGAAIYLSRYYDSVTATITNTIISGNMATQGSAIYSQGGDLVLVDSTVSGNLGADAAIHLRAVEDPTTATQYSGGSLTLDNTDVINNAGNGVTASVATGSDLVVVASEISGNSGVGLVFAVAFEGGSAASIASITNSKFNNNAQGMLLAGYGFEEDILTVTIQSSEFKDNIASNNVGGGLRLEVTATQISDSVISGNTNNRSGGGIYASYNDMLTIENTTIAENSTFEQGGGIWCLDELVLRGSNITGNSAAHVESGAGGIYAYNLVLEDSTLSGNHAAGPGGGIAGDSIAITRSTVSNNFTTGDNGMGGGIFAYDSLTVTDSSITGNYTTGYLSQGGGIEVHGDATITSSLISGNSVQGMDSWGGGLDVIGELVISNSTISNNSATGYGSFGGGIVSNQTTITNSTITGNSAESFFYTPEGFRSVGGLMSGPAVISNTIIAGNTAAHLFVDVYFTVDAIDVTYSLIGNIDDLSPAQLAVISAGPGNLTEVDPLLGPLQDNGGNSFTHALLIGSPAINAGDPGFNSPPEFDQRGEEFARVMNERIDMGAYELPVVVDVSGDFNSDGNVDGRDFLTWQRGESFDPFSAEDLEIWQEQYGSGSLSGVNSPLFVDEKLNVHADGNDNGGADPGSAVSGLVGAPEVERLDALVVDNPFVENVDRALEQLTTVTRYGVRDFGNLVVRRKLSPRG